MLKGRLYYDSFAEQMLGVSPLPWGRHQQENGVFEWRDADDDGLGIYLERVLGFRAPAVFKSVLSDCMARQAFNPVTNYLNGWPGMVYPGWTPFSSTTWGRTIPRTPGP